MTTPKETRAEERATCAYIFPDGEACHFPDSYHGRGKGMMPTHPFTPPAAPDATEEVVRVHRWIGNWFCPNGWVQCWCKDGENPDYQHADATVHAKSIIVPRKVYD